MPAAELHAAAAMASAGNDAATRSAGRLKRGRSTSPTAGAPAMDEGTPDLAGEPLDPAGGSLYPAGAPSLLGEFYLAAQGRAAAVVGATRRYGLTLEASLADCGTEVGPGDGEAAAAARELQAEAAALWPAAANWQVGVQSTHAHVSC